MIPPHVISIYLVRLITSGCVDHVTTMRRSCVVPNASPTLSYFNPWITSTMSSSCFCSLYNFLPWLEQGHGLIDIIQYRTLGIDQGGDVRRIRTDLIITTTSTSASPLSPLLTSPRICPPSLTLSCSRRLLTLALSSLQIISYY